MLDRFHATGTLYGNWSESNGLEIILKDKIFVQSIIFLGLGYTT